MTMCVPSIPLSRPARALWAKSDYGEGTAWLPLFVHACDAAAMGEHLWSEWLPPAVRRTIARVFHDDEDAARRVTVFLCAVHDIGKATPVFQARPISFGAGGERDLAWLPERAGLDVATGRGRNRPTHPIAGEMILERLLEEEGLERDAARALASVVGAHHGNPPHSMDLTDPEQYALQLGHGAQGEADWRSVQRELFDLARACAGLEGNRPQSLNDCVLTTPFASLVTGIVIMADWLASNDNLSPLVSPIGSDGGLTRRGVLDGTALTRRADAAWRLARIIPAWRAPRKAAGAESFAAQFGLPATAKPRPVQLQTIDAARKMDGPGMLVVEAPMGEGKTEAALAAAEVLAERFGLGGVCVALPTMATTDAMFGRVHTWLNRLPHDEEDRESIFLAHGKARLNEEYRGLVHPNRMTGAGAPTVAGRQEGDYAVVSSWMQGRKKGMLANFTVCTVDQVLMGALQMRHLPLRQLALAGKVVIIDECHAYDAYMQEYLCRVLEWLGVYGTPVILLSATLPASLRERFVAAYREGRMAQPYQPDVSADVGLLRTASRRAKGSRRRGIAARQREVGDADKGVADAPAALRPAGRDAAAPAPSSLRDDYPYPLLTVAADDGVTSVPIERSARGSRVRVQLMVDSMDELVGLLAEKLAQGGCAGVICNTVSRAQEAALALSREFGTDEVMLTHARFMDIDRMENEARLRDLLGPDATAANGRRPERFIVVGTQVLEQSLDIDFDLLVTDIAPIDLMLQRLGRTHRHSRGVKQADRPERLRRAQCYVRGIDSLDPAPVFAKDEDAVYHAASLMEALAVAGLCREDSTVTLGLPDDIAPMVQRAYGPDAAALIPVDWRNAYRAAVEERDRLRAEKCAHAQAYRVRSAVECIRNGSSLDGFFSRTADAEAAHRRHDDDFGPRAVRDTQESVEVLLLEEDEGSLHLLPWVGSEDLGIETGAAVPVGFDPGDALGSVMAQCAVRLPAAMSKPYAFDPLIDALEERCGAFAAGWQDSSWIAGSLFLPLRRNGDAFETELSGWNVSYTRDGGLSTVRLDK